MDNIIAAHCSNTCFRLNVEIMSWGLPLKVEISITYFKVDAYGKWLAIVAC